MSVDTPKYRYLVANFITGEVLLELQLTNVSFGRNLKSPGPFSGTIPVLPGTNVSELYNATMPGKTALYVLRNNAVVWGGLLWTREYNIFERIISLTGLEFPSYLNRRLIWKTYSFSYNSRVIRDYTDASGKARVVVDKNDSHGFMPGDSINLQYDGAAIYYKYDNFKLKVLADPVPVNDVIYESQVVVPNVTSTKYSYNKGYKKVVAEIVLNDDPTLLANQWFTVSNVSEFYNGSYRCIASPGDGDDVPYSVIYDIGKKDTKIAINKIVTSKTSVAADRTVTFFLDTKHVHFFTTGTAVNITGFAGSCIAGTASELNLYNGVYVVTSVDYVGNKFTAKAPTGAVNNKTYTKYKVVNGKTVTNLAASSSFGEVDIVKPTSKTFTTVVVSQSGGFDNYVLTLNNVTDLYVGQYVQLAGVLNQVPLGGTGTFDLGDLNEQGLIGDADVLPIITNVDSVNSKVTVKNQGLSYSPTLGTYSGANVTGSELTPYILRPTLVDLNVPKNAISSLVTTATTFWVQSRYKITACKIDKTGTVTATLDTANHSLIQGAGFYVYGLTGSTTTQKNYAGYVNNNGWDSTDSVKAVGYTVLDIGKNSQKNVIKFKVAGDQNDKITTAVALPAQTTAYLEVFPNTVQTSKFWGSPDGSLSATVLVGVNSYEYVRELLRNVLEDFQSYRFANNQIEPGVTLTQTGIVGYDTTTASGGRVKVVLTLDAPSKLIVGEKFRVLNVGTAEGNLVSGFYTVSEVSNDLETEVYTVSYYVAASEVSSPDATYELAETRLFPRYKKISWDGKLKKTQCTIRVYNPDAVTDLISDLYTNISLNIGDYITAKSIDLPNSGSLLYDTNAAKITRLVWKNSGAISSKYVEVTYNSPAQSVKGKQPEGVQAETSKSIQFDYLKYAVSGGVATVTLYVPGNYNLTDNTIGLREGDVVNLSVTTEKGKTNSNSAYDTTKKKRAIVISTTDSMRSKSVDNPDKKSTDKKITRTEVVLQYEEVLATRQSTKNAFIKQSGKITFYLKRIDDYAKVSAGHVAQLIKPYAIRSKSFGEFPNSADMGGLNFSIEKQIQSVALSSDGIATITTATPHNFNRASVVNNITGIEQSGTTTTIYFDRRHNISPTDTVKISNLQIPLNPTIQNEYNATYIVTEVNGTANYDAGPWFVKFIHGTSRTLSQRTASGILYSGSSQIIVRIISSDKTLSIFNGDYIIYSEPTSTSFTYQLSRRCAVLQNTEIISVAGNVSRLRFTTDATYNYAVGQNVKLTGASGSPYNAINGVSLEVKAVDTSRNTFDVDFNNATIAAFGESSVLDFGSNVFVSYPQMTTTNISAVTTTLATATLDGGIVSGTDFIKGSDYQNVAKHLDTYSNSINGFEYRIDANYNATTNKFEKTFVFIPINFYDPKPGEVSDPSRFGADQLQFEYPGNIINVSLAESAEEGNTRFFVVGDTQTGDAETNPYSSAASSTDLLGAGWPLLEGTEKAEWPILANAFTGKTPGNVDRWSNNDIEADLYKTARRYLTQSRPPTGQFSVVVNGNFEPQVGTYAPGDWCQVNIDNPFLKQRLQSGLEPRNTTFVRKIDGYTVEVPNSPAEPERVTLNLKTEWMVDRFPAQIAADDEYIQGSY